MITRGVQIRSESDGIRSDFGKKIFTSYWIELEKLFHNRIGSDWMSATKFKVR